MSIEIVVPQGAFGASDNDTLLDIVLRCIAEACPHHESSWAEKYGTNYENDVFMMHPFCYSDDTEVCTQRGFVLFKELKDDDLFLSLNPETRELEYVPAEHRIALWTENMTMKHIKGRSVDLLVTPEHRMFVLDYAGRPVFKKIKDLVMLDKLTAATTWHGSAIDTICIGEHKIPINLYCEFMGFYLAEGSCIQRGAAWYQCSIGQSDPDIRKRIVEITTEMGISCSENEWQVYILDKSIKEYLFQFGKAHEKYVPDIIKTLPPEQISIFLFAYLCGDGTVLHKCSDLIPNARPSVRYYTTSKKMVDDLCLLLIKTGVRPTTNIITHKGTKVEIRGKTYKTNHTVYSVNQCYKTNAYVKNLTITDMPYTGYVYDVTLEKNHTLLVRRNGKIWWGSNCWCEQDDCPWCAGCTCDESGAYRCFIDEQEVTAEECCKFRYDANLPYGEPNFEEELEKLEQHCRVEHIPENACPYCKGELFLEQGAEPGRGAPNFWYKPTGFKVWWYKYIGRGVETNGVAADLLEILRSCLASLEDVEDG